MKRRSVLLAFVESQLRIRFCLKCKKPMMTLDEKDLHLDRICTNCGKEQLRFLRDSLKAGVAK